VNRQLGRAASDQTCTKGKCAVGKGASDPTQVFTEKRGWEGGKRPNTSQNQRGPERAPADHRPHPKLS